jgi:hypothetical protein
MQCKYCKNNKVTKNGHDSRGNQRYLCKKCNHPFSNESRKKIPFEFKSFALHKYYNNLNFQAKRSNFPTFVNLLLEEIDYEPVHRTTIYLWINKYHQRDLIPYEKALEWLQKNIKKELKNYQKAHKKKHSRKTKNHNEPTAKEKAHEQDLEEKLWGIHTEKLAYCSRFIGLKELNALKKHAREIIDKLYDELDNAFLSEKYRKNKLKIDNIYRKRDTSDIEWIEY